MPVNPPELSPPVPVVPHPDPPSPEALMAMEEDMRRREVTLADGRSLSFYDFVPREED
ncbi:MAG: hypothetical protein VKO21_05760 [Candidatus Sericytochromatia bacterium]|nr:hypothetical protein [Candidatus Sericytochromatia bacterium]